MSNRPQKLQKLKPISKLEPPSSHPVTQTIIINNPNININYMNESNKNSIAGPMSSRGLDNWNLNNNLKQFSETRQLGFYKKKDRNKSNSPYIIHKVRTQDFRSINKVYAHGQNGMKDTISGFRKNETLGHITPAAVQYDIEPKTQRSALERVMGKRDKTITEKFYQGQVKAKKNPRIELLKNFQTLPTTYLANPQTSNIQATNKFRKGRFQIAPQAESLKQIKKKLTFSNSSNDSLDSPTKNVRMQQKYEREADSADSTIKLSKGIAPRLNLELKKRAFNKTIASIDKLLLSNTEDYFDQLHSQKLPQSQIQLCVNGLGHPQRVGVSKDKSVKRDSDGCRQYDFMFEQQRKKRPRTPRRKKMYQPL